MMKYEKMHTLQVINYAMTTKIVCTLIILQDLLSLKAFKIVLREIKLKWDKISVLIYGEIYILSISSELWHIFI